MNRAMRRQGQKNLRKAQLEAKRRAEASGIAMPQMPRASIAQKPPHVEEHERLNQARARGLLVPPTPEERQGLERQGHTVPRSSGLWTPPQ